MKNGKFCQQDFKTRKYNDKKKKFLDQKTNKLKNQEFQQNKWKKDLITKTNKLNEKIKRREQIKKKQKNRQQKLSMITEKLEVLKNAQKKQEAFLTQRASDFKNQESRQIEKKQKLMIKNNELNEWKNHHEKLKKIKLKRKHKQKTKPLLTNSENTVLKKNILTFTNENVSTKHGTYLHKSQSKSQENISNMVELSEESLTREVQKKNRFTKTKFINQQANK